MSTAETNIDTSVKLAVNQELIWLGQQLQSDVPLFEVPYLYTIHGEIDPRQLVAAFDDLVGATETLRLVATDSGWSQPMLANRLSGVCEWIDLSQEPDSESALDTFVAAQLQTPFSPVNSLCQAALIRVDVERWKLFVKIHHALTDALCGRALLKNLAAFYDARVANTPAPVSPAYADYLIAETEAVTDSSWWADRARTRSDTRFYRAMASSGTVHHTRVAYRDSRFSEWMNSLATAGPFKQITPALSQFNVLMTALNAWLYRLSPTDSVTLGATAHGRSTPRFRNTIGLFMQLLPFRVLVDADDTFESISRKVAAESMGFLRHSMPGSMTAAAQRAFDVVLNLIDLEVDDFCGRPTSMQWLHNGYGEPSRKLCLSAYHRNGDWELLFDFNDDAFGAEERQRAIEHLSGTIKAMAVHPGQPIKDYPLLTTTERQRLAISTSRLRGRATTETRYGNAFASSRWQTSRVAQLCRRPQIGLTPTYCSGPRQLQAESNKPSVGRLFQSCAVATHTLLRGCSEFSGRTAVSCRLIGNYPIRALEHCWSNPVQPRYWMPPVIRSRSTDRRSCRPRCVRSPKKPATCCSHQDRRVCRVASSLEMHPC